MTKRKFYRTVFTVEILSEKPLSDGIALADVNYMIVYGEHSGRMERSDPEELDGLQAARALKKHGSDLSFFHLDEDGNDAD